MSDKVPVQMELAERLAGLVHVQNDANGILYMMCFWKTIAREWNGIDRLRFASATHSTQKPHLDLLQSCQHQLPISFVSDWTSSWL